MSEITRKRVLMCVLGVDGVGAEDMLVGAGAMELGRLRLRSRSQ